MAPATTIVLIGPRGAGKTSVGRLLGQRIARPFVDLDDLVRARFGGATVAEIWARHGEAAFRAAEAASVDEALTRGTCVLALGGGTPMIDQARRALETARRERRVLIALLLADEAVLGARIAGDATDRPSLTGAPPSIEVNAVLAARLPTYRALADETFDTSLEAPSAIAETVARWAQRRD